MNNEQPSSNKTPISSTHSISSTTLNVNITNHFLGNSSQSKSINNNDSTTSFQRDSCSLTTCGHYCNLCQPILQQLILITQKSVQLNPHPVNQT